MGKVKMKRKSTLIDMTAMSDVTVLLLTFFMLTSTFLAKEPVQVITPSSVSEIKVPDTNVVNILVSPKGEVYLALTGDADPENAETMGSEAVRKEVLRDAAKRYKELTGKDVGLTPMDIEKFAKQPSFGIPLEKMHEFLTLDQTKQDNWLSGKDLKTNPAHVTGIPLTDITYKDENGNVLKTNEFQIWMRAIYNNASNQNIHDAIQSGEGINVKADRGTKYETIHPVLDNLQTIKMNKFSIMTALKTEAD